MPLRAFVPHITTCLYALNYHAPPCLKLPRAYVLTCLHALRAYVPLNFTCYVLYVPTCLSNLNYMPALNFMCPQFLCACHTVQVQISQNRDRQ